MNLQWLLARWRQVIDDKVGHLLVANSDGTDMLNMAVEEACVRARLLRAQATQSLVIDQAQYAMPAGWFELSSAHHDDRDVRIVSLAVAQHEYPRWRTDKGTSIDCLVADIQPNAYVVTPIPSAVSTLYLHGYRVPAESERMTDSEDAPIGIDSQVRLMDGLCHWAAYLAYTTRDADMGSLERAQYHEAKFESVFGPSVSANSLRIRQQVRGQRVRARFF